VMVASLAVLCLRRPPELSAPEHKR
jgi:hypothetical protein